MQTAASGDADARPPVASHAAQSPEVAVRPTARERPTLAVRTSLSDGGYTPDDPYVRKFWVAAIGAGAVAELLRLIQAGNDGRRVPLPRWLPSLIRADLVHVADGDLVVGSRLPEVPVTLRRRFAPGLREQHRREIEIRSRP